MKTIPNEIKGRDCWIILLKDIGDYALYFNKSEGFFAGFEVHKIRVKPPCELNIKQEDGSIKHISIPERRAIANSEEFGKNAWHYPTLDSVFYDFDKSN